MISSASQLSDAASIAWRANIHTYAAKASGGRWRPYRHTVYAARYLQERILQGDARIIVCWPPRHGKSELFSHWLPTWYLDTWPDRRVILTAYEATVATDWGRMVRDEFETNPLTWTRLKQDTTAANKWNTPEGGGMICAGLGGPITGRGFNLGIIEDPIKNWREAVSPSIQRRNEHWFNSTFYTRREPGASIIVVMHRWDAGDLVGFLTREPEKGGHGDDWELLEFPALIETEQDMERDPLGRDIGEPLCPERYDRDWMDSTKKAQSDRIWRSMYQQRPGVDSGEIFKRKHLRYWGPGEGCVERPSNDEFDELIQSWDCTFKDTQESAWVVGQVWGRIGVEKYLLDQVRERAGFTRSLELIRYLSQKYPHCNGVLIEDKANGPAIIETMKKKIDGIIPVEPEGGKVARAHAVEYDFEAGQVIIPDPALEPWVPDYIEELLGFPGLKFDDQVDATTQALYRLGAGFEVLIGRA